MAHPSGLLPVLVFVLTAGLGVSVTLLAHLDYRRGQGPIAGALHEAMLVVLLAYLIGVVVVWGWAGFGSLWGVPALLVGTGLVSLVAFLAAPLLVGRWLIRRVRDVDRQTALRLATDSWAVAMLLVFGVFVAPSGPLEGHLLHLDGPRTGATRFCGISVPLAVHVVLQALIGALGPGVIGLALAGWVREPAGRSASP